MKKKALVLSVYMVYASPTIAPAKTLTSSFKDLNLGEVKSYSNLGEPFKGIIPILSTSHKQAKQLKIRLVPKSIFTKLRAERSAELSYLKFKIKILRKKPVIVVSSSRPINSPILNFILEVESTKGVVYQDYTVMLNPPTYKAKLKSKKTSHTAVVATTKKQKKHRHKTFSSTTKSRDSVSRYRVKSGDTLSEIAQYYRHKGISLKKMIKSIHRANPRAFIHDDINKLKKGVVLHIPSKKQIKKIYKRKAKSSKNLGVYKVEPGDTLSEITKRYLYEGVSFTKMMKAIFIANPEAFSKNKMSVLLSGAKLRIPTYEELVGKKTRATTANKHTNTLEKISQTKIQTNNQVSLNKSSEEPFNERSSNNPKTVNLAEAIEALEYSNIKISKLQKKIRELRGNLSTITVGYNDLEKALSEDDFLVKISPKTITNDNSFFTSKSLALISENSLSPTNLGYTILALLLGAILIRYRDKIYSYNTTPYDNPDFYPSDQDIIQQSEEKTKGETEKEEQSNLSKTITEPLQNGFGAQNTHTVQDEFPWNENNTEFLPKKIREKASKQVIQQEENSKISEELLRECDLLIDELILELANKTSKKSKQQTQAIDHIVKPEHQNN